VAAEPTLLVSELFYSIQGESTLAGAPCAFIRLDGCNLRCSYCDARYTYEEPGQTRTVVELTAFIATHPTALVEITGGEPLLQDNVYPLMAALVGAGRTVLLETNGSLTLDRVPTGVGKVMDIECPASGMQEAMRWESLACLTGNDNLKFVLSSRDDFTWAADQLRAHLPGLGRDTNLPVAIFSPVLDKLAPARLAAWILAEGLPVRLQLQLHKLLWPGSPRGV